MSAAATHEANRSCRDVLRNRHVAGLLLAAVPISVPRAVKDGDALRRPESRESGWRILRRRPVAARLLMVTFFFNFYMPIEVALPLYVRGTLDAGASALGFMWGALGVGAFIGAALVNQLRNLPQRHLLIAISGLWAVRPIVLAFVGNLAVAMLTLLLLPMAALAVLIRTLASVALPAQYVLSITRRFKASNLNHPAGLMLVPLHPGARGPHRRHSGLLLQRQTP